MREQGSISEIKKSAEEQTEQKTPFIHTRREKSNLEVTGVDMVMASATNTVPKSPRTQNLANGLNAGVLAEPRWPGGCKKTRGVVGHGKICG